MKHACIPRNATGEGKARKRGGGLEWDNSDKRQIVCADGSW